jgi:hypothetical protein
MVKAIVRFELLKVQKYNGRKKIVMNNSHV